MQLHSALALMMRKAFGWRMHSCMMYIAVQCLLGIQVHAKTIVVDKTVTSDECYHVLCCVAPCSQVTSHNMLSCAMHFDDQKAASS